MSGSADDPVSHVIGHIRAIVSSDSSWAFEVSRKPHAMTENGTLI
ncbi:MAG: hypothetical protein OXP09_18075 [Gammaproteobacteria bacterium]|nr:hypothetical protein [Gammaproteobacteria bacterium]MDE0367468.1 hypothetical protein [Gammaproteobacteria bacterium]